MREKKCSKCGILKDFSNYYIRNGKPISICKECIKKYSHKHYRDNKEEINRKRVEYAKEYRQRNKRTKVGWYTKTYGRMKRDNKKKFGLELPFTKDEFIRWIDENYKEKFNKLFMGYIESDCDKYLNPSIDRIDDYKSYVFDNMQLITWKENDIKGSKGIKNKVTCAEMGKKFCSKEVIQLDNNKNIIMCFSSTHEVGRILGFDPSLIAKACREGFKSKGYYWKYK